MMDDQKMMRKIHPFDTGNMPPTSLINTCGQALNNIIVWIH